MEDRSVGNRYVTTPDVTGRCCALCGNPRQLQKCGRCFRVFYCSKDCQRNDWGSHRSLCLEAAERAASAPPATESPEPDEDDDKKDGGGENTSQGTPDICKHCRKRGLSYKICGGCLTATYCSKECQRVDWKLHKRQCWQARRPRLQMDMERSERLQNFPLPSDPPLPSTARRSHSPALSWTQAIQRAQQLHPDKPVLTKLGEVVEEENLDPIKMTNTVFLARLLRPLSYLYQHAWFLEDVRGDQMRVFFYLEHTNVEPHFQWQQLDVGNFLCLEHAYIHTFMDLTRGFRVDDPSDVAIIGH